jgi:NAD(P)-dependent dehydrogenase (short-subunit alcohol dehydrogenase family)
VTQFFDKLQQANDTAERQRKLQKENPDSANDRSYASQTGARDYPVPPFPKQHIPKPGEETALTPAPMYDAPYYKGSEKLKDKVALITGGDSGIGRAVAVLYAREGASVIVLYLEEENDAAYTQKLVEQEGRKCLLIKGDVRDLQFCKDAVEQAMSSFGQLNILVNNAAFQLHTDHFRDLSAEHFDETIKTNLYGYFNMTKAVLPHLTKGASIINTGSVTGLRGSKNLVDYSMTKGGIHAYTRALAGNLLPEGIRVNAVAPGPVWTPLNPADQAASDVAHFGSDTPMKRPAQPEELAPAYVFLASEQTASYITGEILPVIGGY